MGATTQRKDKERERARILYLIGEKTNEQIATELKVSPRTINDWSKKGNWDSLKAASKVTRAEIVNISLAQINRLYKAMELENDQTIIGELVDQITKLANVIEKVDKGTNIVNFVEVFNDFDSWLEKKAADGDNEDITFDFIDRLVALQDIYTNKYAKK